MLPGRLTERCVPFLIYWVDGLTRGRVAIMPRPHGGERLDAEIKELRQLGVDVLVSLLTEDEIIRLELSHEPEACQSYGIQFRSFPIPDRSVPDDVSATRSLARDLLAELEAGKSVAIHCWGGIGRSALICACVMILAGIPWNRVIELMAIARGFGVPETWEQRLWVKEFAQAWEPH